MKRKWISLAAAAVLAALALLLLHGTGDSGRGRRQLILLSVSAEGLGEVLVNGSSTSAANSTKPFLAVLEARPGRCWFLRAWLVNGSPTAGGRLEVTVRGNTTVTAIFERLTYAVRVLADANASARVNGTLYQLPAELKVPCGSVLVIEPVAPEGYRPLNGTVTVAVEGDAVVRLTFARTVARVRLLNLCVPVSVNGTPYGGVPSCGKAELMVPVNSTLIIEPRAVDQAGCTAYNGTHFVCLDSWLVNGSRWLARSIAVRVTGDTVLKEQVVYTRSKWPTAYLEAKAPNGTAELPVVPMYKYMIWPFRASYRVVTVNGVQWFHVRGAGPNEGDWCFVIALPPNWRRVRVYANYTKLHLDEADTIMYMIVRPEPYTGLAVGALLAYCYRGVGTGYNVVTFDRRILELASICEEACRKTICNDCDQDPRYREYVKKYIQCVNCIRGYPACCWSVPLPVEAGWLLFDGEGGELYLRIEILEWES